MIVAGVCSIAWALLVWQWQDPFTAVYTKYQQHKLASSFAAPSSRTTVRPTPRRRPRAARRRRPTAPRIAAAASAYRLPAPRGRAGRTPDRPAARAEVDRGQRHRARRPDEGPGARAAHVHARARASSSTSPATARPTSRRSRRSTAEAGRPGDVRAPVRDLPLRGHRAQDRRRRTTSPCCGRATTSSSCSRPATRASSRRTATSPTPGSSASSPATGSRTRSGRAARAT